MPQFSFTCIDGRTGRETAIVLDGVTFEDATATLKQRGLFPVKGGISAAVAPRPRDRAGRWRSGRVTRRAVTRFTRQLGSLLRAGVPLLRGLEVLARQERNRRMCGLIGSVAGEIREGGTLSGGLARFPRQFDRLYLSMVKAGEAAGALDTILDRLALFMEKSERLRGRVRAALAYPMVVAVTAGGIVTGLMMFVVPRFEGVFASLLKGQRLPALTEAVMRAGDWARAQGGWVLAAGCVAAIAAALVGRTRRGQQWRDGMFLRVPLTGDLMLKAAVARFTRTLGTLLNAGVPILTALHITRETSGNARVADALRLVHDRVEVGESVAAPLAAARLFPDLLPSMVEVGEETGALPDMLTRIADVYDEEVDQSVASLTALIEPLMIVLMALVVGTIVIALFLPMVRIIQSLS